MRTIRGKLIVGVVPGLMLLISGLSAALYIYMVGFLTAQQDATLINRARVVCGRTTWSDDTPPRIRSSDTDYGEFGRSNRPSCFEIFDPDGKPVIRSQLLGASDLPLLPATGDEPRFTDVTFPNGRPGRAVCLRFSPSPVVGASSVENLNPAISAGGKFTIVLAKDAGPVRDPTLVLLLSLIALVAIMATGIIVLMSLSLRRGLQPLQQIARQATARSTDDAPELFPTQGMPGELLPICHRLNDLLRRLYDALQRQRRFTTDAAHELRTPIAEIRAVAEVAAKWADLPTARAALTDILEVTNKMGTIVTTLLDMARCDHAKQTANLAPVKIQPLIDKIWRSVQPRAQERHLQLLAQIDTGLFVHSDPVLLESILVNLFSNAADYATADSTICCTASISDTIVQLQITNEVTNVTSGDLSHIFEPFWRKNAAGSDECHSGLGLTLSRAYAVLLKIPLDVALVDANRLRFSLQLPLVNVPVEHPSFAGVS